MFCGRNGSGNLCEKGLVLLGNRPRILIFLYIGKGCSDVSGREKWASNLYGLVKL